MIITGAAPSVYARASARPRHRVELLNACSGLDSRSPRESRRPTVNRQGHEPCGACHSETPTYPGMIESRLSSTFVAQVLGQDQRSNRADAGMGGRAYAQTAHRPKAPRLLRLV
jgi:hypothetical protein